MSPAEHAQAAIDEYIKRYGHRWQLTATLVTLSSTPMYRSPDVSRCGKGTSSEGPTLLFEVYRIDDLTVQQMSVLYKSQIAEFQVRNPRHTLTLQKVRPTLQDLLQST